MLRDQRYGKSQARRVLALLASYSRKDLLAALERAVRFGAYSVQAVERILAVQAGPKSVLDILADDGCRRVQPLLDEPVSPRGMAEYQQLCEETSDHGPANQTNAAAADDNQRRPRPAQRTCVSSCWPTSPRCGCRSRPRSWMP